jgi:hypothetical protein
MISRFQILAVIAFALSSLCASCQKEEEDALQPRTPVAPTAHAGNDTTLMVPFSSYKLDGGASKDPDSNIVFYAWRQLAGPSFFNLTIPHSVKSITIKLIKVGTYVFELTVTDADKLSSRDTIKVNVAIPPCTSATKEFILKNLVWITPWLTEIDIYDPHKYLPLNSHIQAFYIKRDSSDKWEQIVPLDYNSPNYGILHEWAYGNRTLVIWPGNNKEDDTPDIKIEYCQ